MNIISRAFQYLNKLYPSNFVSSLAKDNFLYRSLFDKRPEADIWRQYIDDCLEMVYRYNLLDSDLEARLKGGDRETWVATVNELRVAKYLERLLCIRSLHWRPEGREGKFGDFEINFNNTFVNIFVEVKTIFTRDLDKLEEHVKQKLRNTVKKVQIPIVLDISIEEIGKLENFSEKRFEDYLKRELQGIDLESGKRNKLRDYIDQKTGLHLEIETLPIQLKSRRTCHIGRIGGGELRLIPNDAYIRYSLKKAYNQKPPDNKPYLVILCPSTQFPIDEIDMQNALFRKLDGFYHPRYNRHLSATGIFKENFWGNSIEDNLEIYHNPFALNRLDKSLFEGKGVRQLVRKNDEEMEWIE